MNNCHYCHHTEGSHHPACFHDLKKEVKVRRTLEALFSLGWRNGRNQTERAGATSCIGTNFSNHPAYKLGFQGGVIAKEEYENGHDTRWDE